MVTQTQNVLDPYSQSRFALTMFGELIGLDRKVVLSVPEIMIPSPGPGHQKWSEMYALERIRKILFLSLLEISRSSGSRNRTDDPKNKIYTTASSSHLL